MVSIVNDCGDKYSKVEYTRDGLQWDFERAQEDQNVVWILAFISMGLLGSIIVLVFGCYCCWSYSNYMRQHRAVDDVDFDSINQSELRPEEKSELE